MQKNRRNIQKMLNTIIVFLIIILLSLIGYYIYMNRDGSSGGVTDTLKIGKESKISSSNADSTFSFKTIAEQEEFTIHATNKDMLIEGLENKLVFLKIFGWDCQYCQKEIPQLIKLKRDLGETFEVIAIEAELHSDEEFLKYIKQYGINYPIINGERQKKFYDYLKRHYGWSGVIPVTIVIGRAGHILAYEVGAKSYTLAELMKASLEKEKSIKK